MKKKRMKKLLKQLLAERQAPVPPPQDTRTLSEWLPLYQAILAERKYKAQTIKNRAAALRHVSRLWGDCAIAALKPHAISAALQEFLPTHSSTARRVLAELREVYAEAAANDWVANNPVLHVKPPKHRVKRKRLTFEVWSRMRELAASSTVRWIECMLLLALVTGQRRADLAKMRFDDVVDGYLRIEQQKQAGKGYGARVAIPLTLTLDAIGLSVADVIERCRQCGRDGPTMLRRKGGGGIELSSLSARFNEYIKLAVGAGTYDQYEWPSLHEIRSLSARLYRAQGIDVQTLLGHKHAEMTAIYEDDRGLSAAEWKQVATQPH